MAPRTRCGPERPQPGRRVTPLDYLIGGYFRSARAPRLPSISFQGGRGRQPLRTCRACSTSSAAEWIAGRATGRRTRPGQQTFPGLDCGQARSRRLLLRGATLLHVAAEFAVSRRPGFSWRAGASSMRGSHVDEAGVGDRRPSSTPPTQFQDRGMAMTRLLVRRIGPVDSSEAARALRAAPGGGGVYAARVRPGFPGSELPGSNTRP